MNTKLKNKIIFWLILFLFLFNITTVGYIFIQVERIKKQHQQEVIPFQPPNKPPMTQHPGRGFLKRLSKKVFSELNLNQQQIKTFNQLKHNYRTQTKIYVDTLRFYRQIFDNQLESPNPDYEKMILAAKKIGEYHEKLRLNFFNFYKQFRETLNDQQKQKLAQIFKELKQKPKN